MSDITIQDFTSLYPFKANISSFNEPYLLFDATHQLHDLNSFVVVSKEGYDLVCDILENDYFLPDEYKNKCTKTIWKSVVQSLHKHLVDTTSIYLTTLIKVSKKIKFLAEIVRSDNKTFSFVITSWKDKRFVLCDNYEQYELFRTNVNTGVFEFKHLQRIIKSFSSNNLDFFNECTRPAYNQLIIAYLTDLNENKPLINFKHIILDSIKTDNGFVACIPAELQIFSNSHTLDCPYINCKGNVRNNNNSCWIQFDHDYYLTSNRSIKLIGSIHPRGIARFPKIIVYSKFDLYLYSDHFKLLTKSSSVVVIKKNTTLFLQILGSMQYGSVINCVQCQDTRLHPNKCFTKIQMENNACNQLIQPEKLIAPIGFACIGVVDFKDSPNLVRASTISMIDAFAKLCNVVSAKYSNKVSNCDPINFLQFLKSASNFTTENLSEKFDQFDFSDHIRLDNEADKTFMYFGTSNNIEKFTTFLTRIAQPISIPTDKCQIYLRYSSSGFCEQVVKIIPGFEHYSHNFDVARRYNGGQHPSDECITCNNCAIEESERQFDLTICDKSNAFVTGPCPDWYISETPNCFHGPSIPAKCKICKEYFTAINNIFTTIMFKYGIHFDNQLPILQTKNQVDYTIVPILIKPNGFKGTNLKIIADNIKKYDPYATLNAATIPDALSERMFSALYPSAASNKRKFAKHWHHYIMSDVTSIFFLRTKAYMLLRFACLDARTDSKLEWTKNIVHSAESDDEFSLFAQLLVETISPHPETLIEPCSSNDGTQEFLVYWTEDDQSNKRVCH